MDIPMHIPMKAISSGFDIAIWPTSARENSHGNSRPQIVVGFSFDVYFSGGKSSINPLFPTGKELSEIHVMRHILLFNR